MISLVLVKLKEQGRRYLSFFAGFFFILGPLLFWRNQLPEELQRWVPDTHNLLPDWNINTNLSALFAETPPLPSEQPAAKTAQEPPSQNKLPSGNPDSSENALTGPFLKNPEGLSRFYQKLAQLSIGRRDQVKIMHFGDSLLWHENTAREIRKQLQRDFGDGGRGFVYLHHDDYGIALSNVEASGDQLAFHTIPFNHFNHEKPNWLNKTGFTGMTYQAQKPDLWSKQTLLSGKPWNTLEVILRTPEGMAGATQTITLRDNRQNDPEIEFQAKLKEGCASYRFEIPPLDDISINFGELAPGEGSAYIDGLHLERQKGITYNSYIHKGRHMSWMTAIPPEQFECGYRAMKPDLIIMQFGVNESASIRTNFHGYTKEDYIRQMRDLYTRIRTALPEVEVLIIGPFERYRPKGEKFIYYPEHDTVRKLQQQVAQEFGFAFFDSYAYFGGHGQLNKMIPAGLALKDYAHLSAKGADLHGAGIYTEIFENYEIATHKRKELSQKSGALASSGGSSGESAPSPILFNSMEYLYFFLFVGIVGAFLLRWPMARLVFLVVASWYFYASWKWWALLIMLFSTLIDYTAAIRIDERRKAGGRGTAWLIGSLIGNLGVLFFFKYYDFFAGLLNPLFASAPELPQIPLLHLLLPVGISFYTFQSLSYTIDVWRGDMAPERSFWRFSLFVSFFTQLVAGPIVRAEKFLPALKEKIRHFAPKPEHISAGLVLIFGGLLKKTLADWLAMHHVDNLFTSPAMYTASENLAGVYGFGVQIYLDFSGYTDMAIGSAMLLGFHLTKNFQSPYLSVSISDFWRRWHISLGSWIKDYLYISLGGNRKRLYINLLITMLLAGLWHGAGVNFVLWGLFHGVALALERLFKINRKEREDYSPLARFGMTFLTFHLVMFGWIMFRSHDWATFTGILEGLSSGVWTAPNLDWRIVAAISLPLIWHFIPQETKNSWRQNLLDRQPALQGAFAALLVLIVTRIQLSDVKSFIYFQF